MMPDTDSIEKLPGHLTPLLQEVAANLVGSDRAEWGKALPIFLKRENPWPHVKKVGDFDRWEFITIDGVTRAMLSSGVEESTYNIDPWAEKVFVGDNLTLSDENGRVELVVVSPIDLGLPDGSPRSDFFDAALEIGFELCPADLGPQVAAQNLILPTETYLYIAMQPVRNIDGQLSIFSIQRNIFDKHCLYAHEGEPGLRINNKDKYLFIRPAPPEE